MGYNDGNWGVGEWLAMGAFMLLFWGLLAGLVVWAVRGYRGSDRRGQPAEWSTAGPETVLAKRYASGEIDEEEFVRRRDLLQTAGDPRAEGERTR